MAQAVQGWQRSQPLGAGNPPASSGRQGLIARGSGAAGGLDLASTLGSSVAGTQGRASGEGAAGSGAAAEGGPGEGAGEGEDGNFRTVAAKVAAQAAALVVATHVSFAQPSCAAQRRRSAWRGGKLLLACSRLLQLAVLQRVYTAKGKAPILHAHVFGSLPPAFFCAQMEVERRTGLRTGLLPSPPVSPATSPPRSRPPQELPASWRKLGGSRLRRPMRRDLELEAQLGGRPLPPQSQPGDATAVQHRAGACAMEAAVSTAAGVAVSAAAGAAVSTTAGAAVSTTAGAAVSTTAGAAVSAAAGAVTRMPEGEPGRGVNAVLRRGSPEAAPPAEERGAARAPDAATEQAPAQAVPDTEVGFSADAALRPPRATLFAVEAQASPSPARAAATDGRQLEPRVLAAAVEAAAGEFSSTTSTQLGSPAPAAPPAWQASAPTSLVEAAVPAGAATAQHRELVDADEDEGADEGPVDTLGPQRVRCAAGTHTATPTEVHAPAHVRRCDIAAQHMLVHAVLSGGQTGCCAASLVFSGAPAFPPTAMLDRAARCALKSKAIPSIAAGAAR
jgi:hypothetical protein